MTTHQDEKTRVRHYCEGLYRLAEAEGALDVIAQQVQHIAKLVRSSDELKVFLAETRIESEGKREALQRILGGRVHPTLLNALLLMIDNDRGALVAAVTEQFAEVLAELRGELEGEVRTLSPLTPEELSRLEESLRQKFHRPIRLQQQIDPSILGGIVVRVGKQVIDGSLLRRLERLRNVLMHGAQG